MPAVTLSERVMTNPPSPPVLDTARYLRDPGYWARATVAMQPTSQQARIFRAVAQGSKQIAIRSGHGVGKTAGLAVIVLWFLLTRPSCRIVVAMPKEDQLKHQLWPEIRRWIVRAPLAIRDLVRVENLIVYRVDRQHEAFGVGQVCRKESPEALQGWHHEHLLVITDEAAGIPDELFRPLLGALTHEDNIWIMTSNPTRRSGFFHAAFHADRERWHCERFSSLDSPLVKRSFCDEVAATYGPGSNAYRFMVLGEFPLQDQDSLILIEEVETAQARPIPDLSGHELRVGVDPARSTDGDPTGLAARIGPLVAAVREVRTANEMAVVAEARSFRDEVREQFGSTPFGAFYTDVIGVGAGVHDRLAELDEPAVPVNVGEASPGSMPGQPVFERLRDRVWWDVRDFIRADGVLPAPGDGAASDLANRLAAELTAPKYLTTSSGKTRLEAKDDMKKRGVRSPNLADALAMTFAGNTTPTAGWL